MPQIAAALGEASQEGRNWRCRCPLCGKATLSLCDNPNGRTTLLIKPWCGCDKTTVRAAVRAAISKTPRVTNGHDSDPPKPDNDLSRIAEALDFWRNQTLLLGNSLADTYLASRLLLQRPMPAVLRYAPSFYHQKELRTFPAVVGVLEHEKRGEVAIHAICLNPLDPTSKLTIEDRKISRGAVKGAAVRLFPIAGPELAVGTGIEDCLAFQQSTGIPAWAVGGDTFLASFVPPPLDQVRTLILLEDRDEPGRKAVAKAAGRFTVMGYRVLIARPRQGKDINDALRAIGLTEPICEIEGYAPAPVEFSEDDLADRFSTKHADELRFLALSSKWYRWQGQYWRTEETLAAFDLARAVCRQYAPGADKPEDIAKARTVAAVERLAKADRRHATEHYQWDAGPWIINPPAKE
jgi:hypothetical protein